MKTINVSVKNNVIRVDPYDYYVCGNDDYTVIFDFDDNWKDLEGKFARFIYKGVYEDVVITNNQCTVPVIFGIDRFNIGVFTNANQATNTDCVSCLESALDIEEHTLIDPTLGIRAEVALNSEARHTHDNKSVIDKFTEGQHEKPLYNGNPIGLQLQSRYYTNDWENGLVSQTGYMDATFEVLTNPIPLNAIILNVSVRFTEDDGITYADIPLYGLYHHTYTNNGQVLPLANDSDIMEYGNVLDTTFNGGKPYARIVSIDSAIGELVALIKCGMGFDYIMGFTVYYIET